MRDFERVLDTFRETRTLMASQQQLAKRAGDQAAATAWEDRQRVLDYAFYVLLFAQLETLVNERFARARDTRCAASAWLERRGWDVYEGRKPGQIPFEIRLALVTDRRGDAYRRIQRYYALRNHVAHEGLQEPITSIDLFAEDLQALDVALDVDP